MGFEVKIIISPWLAANVVFSAKKYYNIWRKTVDNQIAMCYNLMRQKIKKKGRILCGNLVFGFCA